MSIAAADLRAAGLVFLVAMLLALPFLAGIVMLDEGALVHTADRIASGEMLYRDIATGVGRAVAGASGLLFAALSVSFWRFPNYSPEAIAWILLLQAAALLARDRPGLEVEIVGRGDHRPALEDLAGRLGLSDCVRFIGHALAAALGRLLDDEPLRRRLGEGGIAWARRFSWDTAAERIEARLQMAAARRRRG